MSGQYKRSLNKDEHNEQTLLVGVANVDITPDPAMLNWINVKRSYDGVLDPLYAKALVLDDGHREIAIITWDLIDSGEEAVDLVRKAVGEATNISPDRIMIVASHTHSAPRAPYSRLDTTLRATGRDETKERVRAIMEDPVFQSWGAKIPRTIADLVSRAQQQKQPANMMIGRANVSKWLFNRRPIDPDGKVVTMIRPKDPEILPDGLRFGPSDSTLTTIAFYPQESCTDENDHFATVEKADQQALATIVNVPCHAVSVYVEHEGISSDWPGAMCRQVSQSLGGESLFLTGCAGEIVPAYRGVQAKDDMALYMANRTVAALQSGSELQVGPLQSHRYSITLPLAQDYRHGLDVDGWPAEVQVFAIGDVVIVGLPGEPLNGIAREIQRKSPFAHTIVVGYANGWGISYVGLPGEKARGGYEAQAGRGTDECGMFLVETALRLINDLD